MQKQFEEELNRRVEMAKDMSTSDLATALREVSINTSTSSPNDQSSEDPTKRMGTRKKPVQFGRTPNTIRNQSSDVDTYNENSHMG